MVGKDLYGQTKDGICLGMLQGCVEHEVCGEGMIGGGILFFSWKAHDASSTEALRGWLRWEAAGEQATEGGTSEKVAGACAVGCAVVAHLGTR